MTRTRIEVLDTSMNARSQIRSSPDAPEQESAQEPTVGDPATRRASRRPSREVGDTPPRELGIDGQKSSPIEV
jgi:hypothetical protein